MIQFDQSKHEYTLEKRVVPHVTGILKPLIDLRHIKPDVLENARQEGVAIHKMVELDCKGELVDLPDWLIPFYSAWEKFKAEVGFELVASEQQVYHDQLDYAGTFDLVGTLTKIKRPKLALIDIKRSLYGGPTIGLQLAGYQMAWERMNPKQPIQARFALRLTKSETYQFPEYADGSDRSVFLACLTMHKWRQKHGKHE